MSRPDRYSDHLEDSLLQRGAVRKHSESIYAEPGAGEPGARLRRGYVFVHSAVVTRGLDVWYRGANALEGRMVGGCALVAVVPWV